MRKQGVRKLKSQTGELGAAGVGKEGFDRTLSAEASHDRGGGIEAGLIHANNAMAYGFRHIHNVREVAGGLDARRERFE